MDKISVDPSSDNLPTSSPPSAFSSPSTGSASILSVIGVHSPLPPSGNRRQDHGDLIYPFSTVVSPTSPNESENVDELYILEEKISGLEHSVKNILQSPETEEPPPPLTPSPITPIGGVDCESISGDRVVPHSYEELDNLLLPPLNRMKDKMPPGIYQELLAIYESQVLLTDGGIPRGLTNTNNVNNYEGGNTIDASTTTTTSDHGGDGMEQMQNSKNKNRNVRKEMLKWNRD